MKIIETVLQDCFIIEPTIFKDRRGYFMESFNERIFVSEIKVNTKFVQDNESKSTYGVLRGLHYQTGEHAQAKLVRVVKGKIRDVAVDIRPDSSTYGKHFTAVLSDENFKQLYIPQGFAHGFVVLSEMAIVSYKTDNYYNCESEGGILFSDEVLNIDWGLDASHLVLSDKDLQLPKFKESKPIW